MKFWLCIPLAAVLVLAGWGACYWVSQTNFRIVTVGVSFIILIVAGMVWSVTNDHDEGGYG